MSQLKVLGQYIKNLSFKNPNSPAIFLSKNDNGPEMNISVGVSTVKLKSKDESQNFYEVTLSVVAKSKIEETDAFECSTDYCGVFGIDSKVDQKEAVKTILMDSPKILFPFVRHVVSTTTGTGGFPPLMLETPDFDKMYEDKFNSQKATEDVN